MSSSPPSRFRRSSLLHSPAAAAAVVADVDDRDTALQIRRNHEAGFRNGEAGQLLTASTTTLFRFIQIITSAKVVFIDVCLFVCLLAGLRENYSTDFHGIRWKCGTWAAEETVRLCW